MGDYLMYVVLDMRDPIKRRVLSIHSKYGQIHPDSFSPAPQHLPPYDTSEYIQITSPGLGKDGKNCSRLGKSTHFHCPNLKKLVSKPLHCHTREKNVINQREERGEMK